MAIDEVGCVRGKENNRTEKIVKLANTLHRYAAQDPLSFCPIFKEGVEIAVRVKTGAIALTLIPRGPHSIARDRVS